MRASQGARRRAGHMIQGGGQGHRFESMRRRRSLQGSGQQLPPALPIAHLQRQSRKQQAGGLVVGIGSKDRFGQFRRAAVEVAERGLRQTQPGADVPGVDGQRFLEQHLGFSGFVDGEEEFAPANAKVGILGRRPRRRCERRCWRRRGRRDPTRLQRARPATDRPAAADSISRQPRRPTAGAGDSPPRRRGPSGRAGRGGGRQFSWRGTGLLVAGLVRGRAEAAARGGRVQAAGFAVRRGSRPPAWPACSSSGRRCRGRERLCARPGGQGPGRPLQRVRRCERARRRSHPHAAADAPWRCAAGAGSSRRLPLRRGGRPRRR